MSDTAVKPDCYWCGDVPSVVFKVGDKTVCSRACADEYNRQRVARAQQRETVLAPPTPLAVTPTAKPINLLEMTDSEVVEWGAMAREELGRIKDILATQIRAAEDELVRRMKERGAKAIPHPDFEIALTEEYTPYAFDLEGLNWAAKLLSPEEGAKVVKHVPEQVTVVPAHDEPGNIGSIKALADKYNGSNAGIILANSFTRSLIGDKFVFKPRKTASSEAQKGRGA